VPSYQPDLASRQPIGRTASALRFGATLPAPTYRISPGLLRSLLTVLAPCCSRSRRPVLGWLALDRAAPSPSRRARDSSRRSARFGRAVRTDGRRNAGRHSDGSGVSCARSSARGGGRGRTAGVVREHADRRSRGRLRHRSRVGGGRPVSPRPSIPMSSLAGDGPQGAPHPRCAPRAGCLARRRPRPGLPAHASQPEERRVPGRRPQPGDRARPLVERALRRLEPDRADASRRRRLGPPDRPGAVLRHRVHRPSGRHESRRPPPVPALFARGRHEPVAGDVLRRDPDRGRPRPLTADARRAGVEKARSC
jgi:hypothetical protein